MRPALQIISWLWCAWGLGWILAALRNKPTQRREPLYSRLAHVLPLALGAAMLASPGAFAAPLAWRLWPRSPLASSIGVALVVAGVGFAVWARVHLGGNWSGAVTVKHGHELIRSGPYALVRHPIYTGLLTALIGTSIARGTLQGVTGLAIIAAALMRKLGTEEKFMRQTFPDAYPRYSAEVPALIPWARPRRLTR